MNDDLKWQESVQNFRGSRIARLANGDIHTEATVVQCKVWESKLGPFALSIIEGDLYHAARCSVLMEPGVYILGPDMESAKQALLAKLINAFEHHVATLFGAIIPSAQPNSL
jgi:hypothetical protein